MGNEEPLDWDGRAGRRAAGPCRAYGVALHRGHEDVVVPMGVHVQVWRLSCHRAGRERGVRATAWRMSGETLGGRTHDA